jgi:hypothetical protein
MAKLTIKPSRDGVDLMECTDVNAHDLTITGGPRRRLRAEERLHDGQAAAHRQHHRSPPHLQASASPTRLQIGSETFGDFRNISWSNIKVTGGPKSGIGIQMNDGAVIKNVSYENITMTNTSFPIFLSTSQPAAGPEQDARARREHPLPHITASNIVAGNGPHPQNTAIVISGPAGHPSIRASCSENVKITFPGGGTRSGDPPEGSTLKGEAAYNPRFITPMPAYGLFVRHAQGVELHDVKLDFSAADQRPAVIARDVDGLVFDAFAAKKGGAPTLELDTIKNLTIKASARSPTPCLPSVTKMSF